MKRVITLALSVLVIVSLFVVSVSAEAYNPVGGCKTETTIYKANASDVKKDGVIGENEYVEIDINRDPNTTDIMFGFQLAERFDACCEFLDKVHFYLSWDETHGLNVGVTAELLETPWNGTPQPEDDRQTMPDGTPVPGDEFLFQFGMMFRVSDDEDTVMNRGISINTETNTLLYGHYNENGYTGSLKQTAYEDYIVKVNGNTVTYEISFPIESVVPAASLSGKAPVEGTQLLFDVTATGGSIGEFTEGANMYAVSVGDAGYMSQWNLFEEPSHAKGFFTNETIVKGGGEVTTAPDVTTVPDEVTTAPETTQPATSDVVTSVDKVTDTDGNVMTDEDGKDVTEIITSILTDAPTQDADDNDVTSPVTGDPMVIAAVVAAISACGIVVAKKRK